MFGEKYRVTEIVSQQKCTVRRVVDSSGQTFISKIVPYKKMISHYQERKVLEIIKGEHSTFINLIEWKQDDTTLELILDEERGVDLLDKISTSNRLDTKVIKEIFRKLVQGVDKAHDLGIVHRDIKLENIKISLSKEGIVVKILDWGMAVTNPEQVTNPGGSSQYVAPEVLSVYSAKVGPWNDVWGLGVVLYAMMTKRLPFSHKDPEKLFIYIRSYYVNYKVEGLEEDAIDLLKCIFTSFKERFTCKDILKHPFLKEEDNNVL